MFHELIHQTAQEILVKAGLDSIGENVQHRTALEHLARCVVFKRVGPQAHSQELVLLARACARRVQETGLAESLAPMNAYERRVVHTELATLTELETKSIGVEPNRRIVVSRKVL